jgi:DnaK suppressor protein
VTGGETRREEGTAMRKRDLERCRKILLEQRERILGNVDRVLTGELDLDRDDFPDEMDMALAESSLSFTGQIRERERRLLNKIEKSLEKIEQGSYGECESCGNEIGVGRLRARPVASLCIDCKDEQERLERQQE